MKAGRTIIIMILAAFPAMGWAANERAKTDRSTKTHTLLVVDDATGEIRQLKSTASGLKVDSSAAGGGVVDQGISGVSDADPWNMMMRNAAGTELGLAASPFGVSLFDAASNLLGIPASPLAVGGTSADGAAVSGNPVRMAGKSFAGNTEDLAVDSTGNIAWNTATAADNQSLVNTARPRNSNDGTGPLMVLPLLFDGATGDLAPGNSVDGALVNLGVNNDVTVAGVATESTLADVELNTDTATAFADGTVSVTTAATLISAASAPRRSLLIRNADSNTVLFLGPTSGVTTANGLPLKTAGASGANGNGGTIIYTHTAAVWGIVSSGTADVRFQTESD